MDFKSKIAQKRAEAESFRNLTGQRPVEKINPNNKTLSISVVNTTTTEATARIFGAIGTATSVNNAAAGITVTPANATHQELLDTILADPFRITGLKLITKNNVSQFSNALKIVEEDAFGKKNENTVIPISFASNKDYNSKFIEAREFSMAVRKTSYIEFALEGSEELTFIFNVSDKLDRAAELSGRPTLKTEDPYKAV